MTTQKLEEINKSLKERQGEWKNKQVQETIQVLKIEINTIKKTQAKKILEMEYLGK